MSALGRMAKNLETPRPLKARQTQPQQVYEVQSIDELIQLTENVASTMAAGTNDPESMSVLLHNLRIHGPQLEALSKDTLDRAFVTFRNASQDERLNIMTRLNLLELVELRAKSWHNSDGSQTYYKHKASNVEPEPSSELLGTSPTSAGGVAALASMGPNDVIRNSGKFSKPTKIPGKNYSKDEIVIRNADSGKVNPGAKERLVQIAGPNEEKINYAKQLIKDTIRRNESPVRLDSQASGANGSSSSLASSTSDDANQQQQQGAFRLQRNHSVGAGLAATTGGGKNPVTRVASVGSTPLLQSFTTTQDVNEYKYTVSVGSHNLKITGDCFELVRVAKLVLDDYFSGQEFLGAAEAVPTTPVTPAAESKLNPFAPPVVPVSHQIGGRQSGQFVDSGIGLNMLGGGVGASAAAGNVSMEGDDEVFIVESERSSTASSNNSSITASSTPNASSLSRSRRSQFVSEEEGTPAKIRILYEYERLVQYSKSPHAWALPADWTKICLKAPNIVRNKVNMEGAKVLERTYSWLGGRGSGDNENNNNNQHAATNPCVVRFQRNLSFDDSSSSPSKENAGNWVRKSFDAKRSPLVHSKSTVT